MQESVVLAWHHKHGSKQRWVTHLPAVVADFRTERADSQQHLQADDICQSRDGAQAILEKCNASNSFFETSRSNNSASTPWALCQTWNVEYAHKITAVNVF